MKVIRMQESQVVAYSQSECNSTLPKGWITISGNSMYPTLSHGDKVVVSPQISIDAVLFGDMYLIITSSGLSAVRRIVRSEDERKIRIVPDNKELKYGDYQDIDKSRVIAIHKVIGLARAL